MSDIEKNRSTIPEKWTENIQFAQETLLQVEKDFRLQGIRISLFLIDDFKLAIPSLAKQLWEIDFINHSRFGAVIYQIDLPEAKMQREIHNLGSKNPYEFLAGKMIERCFEKVVWRHKYSSNR